MPAMASEAIWNLMEFPIHGEYPPVQELVVHLPGQEVVYFKPDMTEEEIQAKIDCVHTTLMAFFDYNATYGDGRHLLY